VFPKAVRIFRIRLSDWLHLKARDGRLPASGVAYVTTLPF
jgi:hypothetical protein